MAEVVENEVVETQESQETAAQEQQVIQAEYTFEGIQEFLQKDKSAHDKLYNHFQDKVLAKKLGVEALTDELRSAELVPKDILEETNQTWQSKYDSLERDSIVKEIIGKDKFEELKDIIKLDSIKKGEDGSWQGLDVLEKLKTPSANIPKTPVLSSPNGQRSVPLTKEQIAQDLFEKAKAGDKKAEEEFRSLKYQ